MHLGIYILTPVILLLIAHYLITIVLDLPLLSLRIASIAIPVPFGFALLWFSHYSVRWALLCGTIVGVISVTGMLMIVGWSDNVPVVPENFREWREALEYAASIMLAFVTGDVLASLIQRMLPSTLDATNAPGAAAMMLARVTGRHMGKAALRRRAQKIQTGFGTVRTAIGALATATGSIYTGIRFLMGGGGV
jgi:hypothetical protein